MDEQCPPWMVIICLRDYWYIVIGNDSYINCDKSGDNYSGSLITGVSVLSTEFSVSLSWFDTEYG